MKINNANNSLLCLVIIFLKKTLSLPCTSFVMKFCFKVNSIQLLNFVVFFLHNCTVFVSLVPFHSFDNYIYLIVEMVMTSSVSLLLCCVISKFDIHVLHVCVHVGADNGLKSSKESVNEEVSWEEANKRCPLNAMTKNPSLVWPNATVPYKMHASISKLTKDCSLCVLGKIINLRVYCLIHQILWCYYI